MTIVVQPDIVIGLELAAEMGILLWGNDQVQVVDSFDQRLKKQEFLEHAYPNPISCHAWHIIQANHSMLQNARYQNELNDLILRQTLKEKARTMNGPSFFCAFLMSMSGRYRCVTNSRVATTLALPILTLALNSSISCHVRRKNRPLNNKRHFDIKILKNYDF